MPGAKSGWVTVRDAVKKTLPKEVPKPGKFRVTETAEAKPDKGAKTEPEQAPKAEQAAEKAAAAADQAAKAATQAAQAADQAAKAADKAAAAAKSTKKKKEGE